MPLPSSRASSTRELQNIIDEIVAAIKAGDAERLKQLDTSLREKKLASAPVLQGTWWR